MKIYFHQRGVRHLSDMVLLHAFFHAGGRRGVQPVSDHRKHLDNGGICPAGSEEFHHIQADCSAADDDHLFAGHVFGVGVYLVNHVQNRVYASLLILKVFMQPFNRRKEGDRACRIDNKMGVLFLDHVQGSIHAGEDFKVFKLGGAALQVCREVRKSFLGRNLGYFYRKASYGILLFQQRNIASDLRCGAGGFQSGGSCAYYDYVAWLFDGCLFIGFSIDEIRIDGASKGLVASDTVPYASDITGDAFADVSYIPISGLVAPVRIGDQSAAHADQVRIASCQDILRNLRITDIADSNRGLAELVPDSLGHIGAPAVFQIVGINLVLD